jgi:hypothetical protein
MADRHFGHLARDGREHAIHLLDELSGATSTVDAGGRSVDTAQLEPRPTRQLKPPLSRRKLKAR